MVEVLIYSTILIPGPFYTIWRRLNLPEQCPNCKYPQMVKIHTAEGQIARKKFDIEMGFIKAEKNENAALVTKSKDENNDLMSFGVTQSSKPDEKQQRTPIDPEVW